MSDPRPAEMDRITQYLAGELNPHERAEAEAWIAQDEDRQALVVFLRSSRELLRPTSVPFVDVDAIRKIVQQHVVGTRVDGANGDVLHVSNEQIAPNRSMRRRMSGRDGGLGILRQLGWISVVAFIGIISATLLLQKPTASIAARPMLSRTYTTSTGERASLTLVDGTVVTLAPRTVLRVSEFGSRNRTVTLDGEAYFDVSHTHGIPFVVQAGRTSTRVLGTTFVVRHHAGDASVRVAVRTGKVSVTANSRHQPSVTIAAGYIGEITDSSATLVEADMAQYTGWLDSLLIFHNTPTLEVLATLSQWYGYQFRLSDSTLAQQNLTAALSTESSQAALSTVKTLLNVDMRFDGMTVTLMPRRKSPARARHVLTDELTLGRSEVGR